MQAGVSRPEEKSPFRIGQGKAVIAICICESFKLVVDLVVGATSMLYLNNTLIVQSLILINKNYLLFLKLLGKGGEVTS